ncbi:MAG: histidinol-phosphatase HisJ family protein [Christensenellales bacterium]
MTAALSSPHVHSQYCDGLSTLQQMVDAALARGFLSLGLSSHAKQDFDLKYCMSADREDAYIDSVRALRSRYAGRIRLWLGIERDRFSTADRAKFDYVIGSLHYLDLAGQKVAVDGPAARLEEAIRTHFGGDGAALAVAYYRQLGSYIRDYRPDIIGHFDVVMRNNQQHELFDPRDPAVLSAAFDALCEARKGCALMEVNTGALCRCGALAPYPAIGLLRRWRELGGQVIYSSDCHEASQIACGIEEGLQLMREAGFRQRQILGAGDALFDTVSL